MSRNIPSRTGISRSLLVYRHILTFLTGFDGFRPVLEERGSLCAEFPPNLYHSLGEMGLSVPHILTKTGRKGLSVPHILTKTGRKGGSLRLVLPKEQGEGGALFASLCLSEQGGLRVYPGWYVCTMVYTSGCTTGCILGYMPSYVLPGVSWAICLPMYYPGTMVGW